ncbi:NAD-dependent epimerase/dehydratase family protein [Swingsia samuiensis]|uniref:NAD-dependent epimerase/dehydratase family protein n=1 Tax=Swingsia samuiensis TaxID=1293412 RepID=A0A4Y6UHI9_9PROT|nr:NAD-dependent epimerase/dehydratase family protein [Swingsia samuiensis]QDH16972.1 NAD-dependent epimerase/dehydratase family protein [Swingsia samuiensis]
MKIFITGVAGFIGFHSALALLRRGHKVVGVDNLNNYYDPKLKLARLDILKEMKGFEFHKIDISDRESVDEIISKNVDIDVVLHLAAQAGVRYSLVDPYSYVQANVMGQVTLLEASRKLKQLKHFMYASSSSVYGRNCSLPFKESDSVDLPSSLYAVTKRAGELASEAYSYLYGIPQTGLRFFTVYGPWGRPDMAYFSFAKSITEGTPVTLYDGKDLSRDFTYIDDIVDGILLIMDHPPAAKEARILNLGGDHPEKVTDLLFYLEKYLGCSAKIDLKERPSSDVEKTWASLKGVEKLCGWKPKIPLEEGVRRFSEWYATFF